MANKLVITCEHASNTIPSAYSFLFFDAEEDLKSHKGLDIGAFEFYNEVLQNCTACFFKHGETSRLLVELNRTENQPGYFSKYSNHLDVKTKKEITQKYYLPYRKEVITEISNLINSGNTVYHISIHSFTPNLNGEIRTADLGLLFDTERQIEKQFCESFKKEINLLLPELIVKMNYPYLGTDDGLTTTLRSIFKTHYLGIELELNQKHFKNQKWPVAFNQIIEGLKLSYGSNHF